MAEDGQQAIDQARQVDPDVMVLDLGLPVIDGVEVCRVVRTFSDCIVMLTARTEEIDQVGYPFHCPNRPKAVPLPHPLWCWRPLTLSSSGAVLLWAVKWITHLH